MYFMRYFTKRNIFFQTCLFDFQGSLVLNVFELRIELRKNEYFKFYFLEIIIKR